jgi:hypothetical protein
MLLVSVAMKRAWANAGAEALSYSRMTDPRTGTMRERTKDYIVLPHVFPTRLSRAIRYETSVSEDDAREMAELIRAAAPRLVATARWHAALNRAYQQFYRAGGEKFLGEEPIPKLISAAWARGSENPGLSVADVVERAPAAIEAMSRSGYSFLGGIDHVLSQPDLVEDLETSLASAWDSRGMVPAPLSPPAKDVVELLIGEIARARGLNGAVRDEHWATAERVWEALATRGDLGFTVRPFAAGLSRTDEPERPPLTGSTLERSIGLSALFPMDRSIRERVGRLARNSAMTYDPEWTLRSLVQSSAQPYSLPNASHRAALLVGTASFAGITMEVSERGSRPSEATDDTATYFARRWRRSRRVQDRGRPGEFGAALQYAEDPYAYLMGRLWVRVAREALSGDEYTLDDAWAHVHGAFSSGLLSVGETVHRLIKQGIRIDSLPGVSAGGDDDDGRANASLDTVLGVEESAIEDDLGWVQPGAVPSILRLADELHGTAAVERFVASAEYSITDPVLWTLQEEIWERWASEYTWRRARSFGPRGSESLEERVVRELAATPSYDQFLVHVVRRATAVERLRLTRRLGPLGVVIPDYSADAVWGFAFGVDPAAARDFARRVTDRAERPGPAAELAELVDQWDGWRRELASRYASDHHQLDAEGHLEHIAELDAFRASIERGL